MVTYRKDATRRPKSWKNGAPPHIGVWLCQPNGVKPKWRWWNGEFWSVWCTQNAMPCEVASDFNREGAFLVSEISWSFYWPENARVARVNQETGEVTGSGPCPYETDGKAWPFGEVKEKSADAQKLKKKPAGNRKVTQYVLMNNARPIYVADSLQELHNRMNAMPRISWTHYEKLRNRKKA
jgi:hypothetical protein